MPTQVEKMRAGLANLNHCAVTFLSRAAINLSSYDIYNDPLLDIRRIVIKVSVMKPKARQVVRTCKQHVDISTVPAILSVVGFDKCFNSGCVAHVG